VGGWHGFKSGMSARFFGFIVGHDIVSRLFFQASLQTKSYVLKSLQLLSPVSDSMLFLR
jgi:hypothetical protein